MARIRSDRVIWHLHLHPSTNTTIMSAGQPNRTAGVESNRWAFDCWLIVAARYRKPERLSGYLFWWQRYRLWMSPDCGIELFRRTFSHEMVFRFVRLLYSQIECQSRNKLFRLFMNIPIWFIHHSMTGCLFPRGCRTNTTHTFHSTSAPHECGSC